MSEAYQDLVSDNAADEAVRQVLQSHVMFNVLPVAEKEKIRPMLEVRHHRAGQAIVRSGTPVAGMYVLSSGRARQKHEVDSKVVGIGVVNPGSTLGEGALLEDETWAYDLIAEEPTVVVVLPAAQARELMARNKFIEEHFRKFVGKVKVGERLRHLLGSARYTPEQFSEMLNELGVKRIRTDAAVFKQGDTDPRLYLIESGQVELVRTPLAAGDAVTLGGRLGRGAVIGAGGALTRPGAAGGPGAQPHTARAVTDVTVIVIYQQTVTKLVDLNPELAERLREEVREWERYEQRELEIRKRAEGLDLRLKLADAITEDEFRVQAATKQPTVRVKPVKQETDSNNAAACLTMILNHHGRNFPLHAVRAKTGLEGTSITIDDIIRGAENLGFRSKGYAIRYDELRTGKLPGIVSMEGYYYAVLVSVSDREVQLADPRDGKLKRLAKEEFVRLWTASTVGTLTDKRPDAGVFIALEPTQLFELEGQKRANPIRYFIDYIMPYKHFFGEAILAAVVINILGLASPLFIQSIVDTVVVHNDRSLLNMMLAGMVLVAVLTTLMRVVQALLLAHTTTRLDMRIMAEFYRHILNQPMPFFLGVNKGEILSRFGENQKIRQILTGSSITTVMNTLMLTIYFMMMFAYSWQLTLIVIMFLPIFIAIVTYFTPRLKKISQEIFQASTRAQASLIEALNGIESIKATHNEYFARARWENSFVENVNRGFHQQRLALMNTSFFQMAILGMTTMVLWVGANQVMDGTMSIGELMGFNMLMGLVTNPVLQMVDLWNQAQEVRISVDRVAEFLDREPEMEVAVAPERMRTAVDRLEGKIEFHNVNFSYRAGKDTKNIMQEFNLTIEPGDRLAFVGPAGCGKSTIAKMVLGFNIPQSGEVLIDGRNLNQLDLGSLRRNIGVVLQDSFLFAGSVAENIAFGDPEPDMQTVQEVARLAGAEEFILNLPLGYQTPIGEKGQALSGGQRQRVCIARALYRRPKIMIFDEATSALDNQTEALIIKQLEERVLPGRTTISIAHRLTTIMNSDYICYIRDGQVQEKGPHTELINPLFIAEMGYKGRYYDLAQSQFGLPPLVEAMKDKGIEWDAEQRRRV